jgi:hypothetical protein
MGWGNYFCLDSMIEIGKCIKIAEFRHVEALDLGEN